MSRAMHARAHAKGERAPFSGPWLKAYLAEAVRRLTEEERRAAAAGTGRGPRMAAKLVSSAMSTAAEATRRAKATAAPARARPASRGMPAGAGVKKPVAKPARAKKPAPRRAGAAPALPEGSRTHGEAPSTQAGKEEKVAFQDVTACPGATGVGAVAGSQPRSGDVNDGAAPPCAAIGGVTGTGGLSGAGAEEFHACPTPGDDILVAGVAQRPAPTAAARPRPGPVDVGELQSKIHALRGTGQLSKLTVLELRAYLKFKGASTGGKKAELEARLAQNLAATESATVAEE